MTLFKSNPITLTRSLWWHNITHAISLWNIYWQVIRHVYFTRNQSTRGSSIYSDSKPPRTNPQPLSRQLPRNQNIIITYSMNLASHAIINVWIVYQFSCIYIYITSKAISHASDPIVIVLQLLYTHCNIHIYVNTPPFLTWKMHLVIVNSFNHRHHTHTHNIAKLSVCHVNAFIWGVGVVVCILSRFASF